MYVPNRAQQSHSYFSEVFFPSVLKKVLVSVFSSSWKRLRAVTASCTPILTEAIPLSMCCYLHQLTHSIQAPEVKPEVRQPSNSHYFWEIRAEVSTASSSGSAFRRKGLPPGREDHCEQFVLRKAFGHVFFLLGKPFSKNKVLLSSSYFS